MLTIDIYSDTVCPWCFIGKRRLERAISNRGDLVVQINWRAFQLNPDMPTEGMTRAAYLSGKFGSSERASHVYSTIARAGHTERIAFNFDMIERMPNTVDSHRLIRFAERFGRQDAIVEILFRAFFFDGEDIGEHATLVRLAAIAGLDARQAGEFLSGPEEHDAVLSEDLRARRMGIGAVPCFVINGAYALSGAQEPEAFYPLFDLADVGLAAE
ncbi:MAG: DsbA family oxidoreductase [Alphaproteobacteria bacterium]|nr:DsbA family oxidoreductase [Alphaproteobacteria bacterium]